MCGFPREREREKRVFFFKFLKVFFQYFLTIFFNFLTFSLYFTIFSTYFFLFFSMIFLKNWGVFIGEWGKWEASISVLGYTNASHPSAFFIFVWFLAQSLCGCFKAFPRSIFFEFYMHRKLWMSNFQWSFPHAIWSYSHQDIALRRKVMQCWKIHIFQSGADIVKHFL